MLNIITEILREIPVSSVLRERLELARDHISAITAQLADCRAKVVVLEADKKVLQQENADIKVRLDQCQQQYDALRKLGDGTPPGRWGSRPKIV